MFPGDTAAQQWLIDSAKALNALCALASVPGGAATLTPSLPFSVAEALYARGFTSAADVLDARRRKRQKRIMPGQWS